MSTPEEVLSYWFPEGVDDADPETHRRQGQRWMAGGPEVDREIAEQFGETLEQARRGELDHWAERREEGWRSSSSWTSSPAMSTGARPSPTPRTRRPSG
jgi:uncharacterized protein (DUF924 family)